MVARYPLVDVLKAVAAQVIVWHHFATYGPLSDLLHQALPGLARWLFDYGRMAVQVFLVVGGYLAARSLTGPSETWRMPIQTTAKRFVRLTGPYLVALALAVVFAAMAIQTLQDPFVPAAPTWSQWFAHMALLQGLLHVDGLSAGVWYVAIDFQLYASLTWLLWASHGRRWLQGLVALTLTLSSLLVFNTDPAWDNTALYFWGAYGLGTWAWWGSGQTTPWSHKAAWYVVVLTSIVTLALAFKMRLGLALCTGVSLWLWGHRRVALPGWCDRMASYLSQRSYALFLMHFPVLLLVNALFASLPEALASMGLLWVMIGWGISMVCAEWLYRCVEVPLSRPR